MTEIHKRKEGQTLIETAFILFLLLLILFGITEFARAWYIRNSLKNAVRQGARVAVVTSPSDFPPNFTCDNTTDCNNSNLNQVIRAVCCQPGVPRKAAPENTSVTIECRDDINNSIIACNIVSADDTVSVGASTTFVFIVGNSPWPWPKSTTFTTSASMRYE